jgi:uncharacterized glyoxalase superfamily protein PhnB
MAKTQEELLKRARGCLDGTKWKVESHEDTVEAGYEALTVTRPPDLDPIPRDLMEAVVASIHADELGVDNASLQIIEGATYAGTWRLKKAGWKRDVTGNPPVDNGMILFKKYVRITALNPYAAVMENNCTFVVSETPFYNQATLPAPTAGTSGVTYRVAKQRQDDETRLWDGVIERREQLTTTSGVMTVEDDAFKTVYEQAYYGVRAAGSALAGVTVALWPVNTSTQGTLAEVVNVQKNENCTTDIRQRKTIAKALQGSVERYQTKFETGVVITSRNQTAAVNAFVTVAGGVITRQGSKQNDDLTFDNSQTVTTALEVQNATVERFQTKFETGVTITHRNQATAVNAFVTVAGGVITKQGSKDNGDGTFDNSQTVTTAVEVQNATVERYQTVYEQGVVITHRNQAAAVNAFVEVTGGILTRQGSKDNGDGTFDNSLKTTTAITGTAGAGIEELTRTEWENTRKIITTGTRNKTDKATEPTAETAGVVTRVTNKRNDFGCFDPEVVDETGIKKTVQTTIYDDDGEYTIVAMENYTVEELDAFIATLNTSRKISCSTSFSRYPGMVNAMLISRSVVHSSSLEVKTAYSYSGKTEHVKRLVHNSEGTYLEDYTVTFNVVRGKGVKDGRVAYDALNPYENWGSNFTDLGRDWFYYKAVTGVSLAITDKTANYIPTGSITL